MRYWSLIFIVSLWLISGLSHAQSPKIGYVSPVEIIDQAPQTKAAVEKVEKEFSSRESALVREQKKMRGLEDKLKRDGSTMSFRDREKLEADIARVRRTLKRDLEDFREDHTLARNREMAKANKIIIDTIIKVAQEGQYDLILEDVLYASDSINITGDVLEILKKDFKKNAGK